MELAEYFRNLLLVKQGVTRESVLGYAASRFPEAQVDAFSDTQIRRALELLLELFRSVRYSLNQRFEVELVVSRLASLGSFMTSREILLRVQELKREIASAPPPAAGSSGGAPQTQARAAATESASGPRTDYDAPTLDTGPGYELLDAATAERIVGEVRDHKPTLASNLEKALRWEIGSGCIRVVFENQYPATAIEQDRDYVRSVCEEVTDEELALEVEVAERRGGGSEAARDERVELVKHVFRGEVVEEQ
jgi:DNA polymerase-3 subunit gamma/tau